MDVSGLIASSSSNTRSTEVAKDVPLKVDAGYLTVFDHNPIDEKAYNDNTEEYLKATARDGAQALINALFALPIKKSDDGPLAMLPPPITALPRAKPLPKPKPPTKWEQFAATKGIQKKVREKRIWDEEKQEWVNRWGRGGKNKEVEEQWAVEVPANAPDDYDPFQEAKDQRKTRVAKNEKQQQANISRTQGSDPSTPKGERKAQLKRQVVQTKVSTASMGKFDKTLEGEPKLRGVKRKFEPNEGSVEKEKQASLALLSKLDGPNKKPKKNTVDGVLNVRKAIRQVSGGKGALHLARSQRRSVGKKGRMKR